MVIGFTKMHGLGNDFIVIDNLNGKIILTKEQILALCDRHTGIGADGLILVESKEGAHAFMNYYNADGTEAEMCGNGIRCTALFLKNDYFKNEKNFKIYTRAGMKEVKYENDGSFSVNMGKPVFEHNDFPKEKINLEGLELDFVSVGNPHAITFVEDLEKYDLTNLGLKIENNSIFPNKINFEIVEKINPSEFKVKVWERGCGETLACGTGACAVYSVVKKKAKPSFAGSPDASTEAFREIIINLPGGKLFISENKEGEIIMKGGAKSVFSGIFDIS